MSIRGVSHAWQRTPELLLLAAALSACASPVPIQELERSPQFSYSDLVARGVAIGGVVSIVDPAPAAAANSDAGEATADSGRVALLARSNQLASELGRQLRKAGIPVVSWGDVRRRLGEELTIASLEAVRDYGSADPELLSSIGQAMGDEPYILWARIESTTSDIGSRAAKQVNMEGQMEEVGTTYYSQREVVASFSVYRPGSPERWLHAEVPSVATNSATHSDTEGDLVEELIEDFLVGDPEAPPVPSIERAASSSFGEFATALQEQAAKEQAAKEQGL